VVGVGGILRPFPICLVRVPDVGGGVGGGKMVKNWSLIFFRFFVFLGKEKIEGKIVLQKWRNLNCGGGRLGGVEKVKSISYLCP